MHLLRGPQDLHPQQAPCQIRADDYGLLPVAGVPVIDVEDRGLWAQSLDVAFWDIQQRDEHMSMKCEYVVLRAGAALILLVGAASCNLPIDGGFGPKSDLDDTGAVTEDSGGTDSGDTSSTETGDTGGTDPSQTGLGEWTTCTLEDHHSPGLFDDSDYYETGYGTGSTVCRCEVELTGSLNSLNFLPTMAHVELTGTNGTNNYDLTPDVGITSTSWNLLGDQKVFQPSSWAWSNEWDFDVGGNDIYGGTTWKGYVSRLNHNQSFTDCDDYTDVQMKIELNSTSRFVPSRRPVNPIGAESDLDCDAGQTTTTRFQLANFPGHRHLVAMAASGNPEYAGTRVKSVTVTSWNNADEVRIAHGVGEEVLTPSSPSANISADNWWYGSNHWIADRTADDDPWGNPVVELSLECPTTPVGDTINVPQGYGVTPQQLGTALNTVTGSSTFGKIITGTASPTIPIYAVRIRPIINPEQGQPTHLLNLELRGVWAKVALPLTMTGQGIWSLSTQGDDLSLTGTVTQGAQSLTLALTGGSVDWDGSTTTLQAATLVLSPLGDE